MRYILDTWVLLWALEGRDSKIGSFRDIILNDKNIIFVSVASYWEIAIKESIGRIKIEHNISEAIVDKWLYLAWHKNKSYRLYKEVTSNT